MKCNNCGAQLGLDVAKCPYCGSVNQVAIDRQEKLDELKVDNSRLKKNVLSKSKESMLYGLHKRINLVLLGIVVLLFGGMIVYVAIDEMPPSDEEAAQIQAYYDAGEFGELYYYMHDIDAFEDSPHEISQMALLWANYHEAKLYFMKAYDGYIEDGLYNAWELEYFVDRGYDVLAGYVSSYYEDVPEEDYERFKPYMDEINMIFTGILKVPEEKLVNPDPYDYDRQKALKEYVLEVVPNDGE